MLASTLSAFFHVLSVHFASLSLYSIRDLKHVNLYSARPISITTCWHNLSRSLICSDWHDAGLLLLSSQETWWGVYLFHLHFMQMNIVPSSIRLAEARNGHNLLQQPLNCGVNKDQLFAELQMMLLFPQRYYEETIKGTQQLPKECNLTQSVPF